MAEVEAVSAPATPARAGPSAEPEPDERELRLALNPPILYTDVDPLEELEQLSSALGDAALSEEERRSVDELRQYAAGEGSWVLGDDFLVTVERLLTDESLSPARVPLLRVLCGVARRDDVALLLHQDRRRHALLTHAASLEPRPLPEQRAIARLMVNLFANVSSSEWLLYISEWEYNGQPYSNIRATTKVCVTSVLSDDEELRAAGTALLYNIACKEVKTVVFDEVCVELGMAGLQLLSQQPGEEAAWRVLAALARLARACRDLPPLVAMVGPDPAAFRGMSPRIDEQIDAISKLLK